MVRALAAGSDGGGAGGSELGDAFPRRRVAYQGLAHKYGVGAAGGVMRDVVRVADA